MIDVDQYEIINMAMLVRLETGAREVPVINGATWEDGEEADVKYCIDTVLISGTVVRSIQADTYDDMMRAVEMMIQASKDTNDPLVQLNSQVYVIATMIVRIFLDHLYDGTALMVEDRLGEEHVISIHEKDEDAAAAMSEFWRTNMHAMSGGYGNE